MVRWSKIVVFSPLGKSLDVLPNDVAAYRYMRFGHVGPSRLQW